MPYISPEDRERLDFLLDSLIDQIFNSGELNYAITRLINGYAEPGTDNFSYAVIAVVTGVLGNVQSEFYRRHAVPYENMKMATNGDVR